MATRFWNKEYVFLNSLGVPRALGKLKSYDSNTSTPQLTYSDDALVTENQTTITLNIAGRLPVDVFGISADYKFTLENADGTDLITIDPVHGAAIGDTDTVTADGATNSQTMADRFRRSSYNLMDFLSSAEQAQVDAGGNAIDLSPKWVTAMQTIHDAGGGTLYLPSGVIAISNVVFEWTLAHSINIIGAGPFASIIKKFGAGTDTILDFSSDAATVLDVRSEWRDFSIDGINKTSDGMKLTNISTSVTSNVYIHDCLNALNTFGALNMEHYNIGLRSNVNGYVARKSADNIYCNQVSFYGGQIIGNTGLGADMRQGQGWAFHGIAFEQNGTLADTGTGAVMVRDTADDEAGLSRASLYNCHFESNTGGRDILTENCTNLTLAVRDCVSYTPQGNVSVNIGAIKESIFSNFKAPGYSVTTAAALVRLEDFNIGGGTLSDGSGAKFYENVVYNGAGQPNQITSTNLTGVYSTKGTQSCLTATATTLFGITGGGTWIVHAYVDTLAAANYSAHAIVTSANGGDAKITAVNGGNLTLTLSTLNIQATQSSGVTQTVRYSALRISDV